MNISSLNTNFVSILNDTFWMGKGEKVLEYERDRERERESQGERKREREGGREKVTCFELTTELVTFMRTVIKKLSFPKKENLKIQTEVTSRIFKTRKSFLRLTNKTDFFKLFHSSLSLRFTFSSSNSSRLF